MNEQLEALLHRYPQLESCSAEIRLSFDLLCACFAAGGKLLVCGNGGSAADADHIAGELLKRFETDRPVPRKDWESLGDDLAPRLQGALPAIPLTCFNAFHSAFQNDCDGEYAFAQLTYALGRKDDALLCISTSGNSQNVIHAARVARAIGMRSLALTGDLGGDLRNEVDICICAPAKDVASIQELHLPIYHCLCRMIEGKFFSEAGAEMEPRG